MPEASEAAAKVKMPHAGAEVAAVPDIGAVKMSPDVAAAVAEAAKSPAGATASLGLESIGGLHGPMASVGDDYLEVNTDEIRRVAESGRAAMKELEEIIQDVQALVAGSEGYWTGEAAEFFREWVPVGLADFERCVKDLSEYPRELISYADEYEGVITKTEMLAESVEGVEWSGV